MGKVDVRAMLAGMQEQLLQDQAEGKLAGLTVKDLADAVSHPKAPEVIAECMQADAASVQQGEPAPDFSLPWLPGSGPEGEHFTLSSLRGEQPVALIFGSYT